MTTEPADPYLGRVIRKRYRIDALIGRGGMCAVYRGEALKEGRAIAIKVLAPDRAAEPELLRRFQREATSAKRVEHANVVAIYDSGALDDGSQYIAMELLEGGSLADRLAVGPLALPRALAIARQVLLGLGKAHPLGLVHRDVKPDNVMLVDRGGKETVKLVDFGIALNDKAADKLTAAGIAFGTPEYISPEMALGMAVDRRADLYSVGVMLFEMVTGKLPYGDKDPTALMRAHIRGEPPSARAANPAIPPALDQAILRAMQKVPEDRFQSAEAMIEALDAIAASLAPKRKRLGRALFYAGAAVVLLAGGGAALWALRAGVMSGEAPRPAPAPEPPSDLARFEGAPTCPERKAALERLLARRDPSLVPVLRRARDRPGSTNACMARELRAAIRDLERKK